MATTKSPSQGKHTEFGNVAKTQGKNKEFCMLKLKLPWFSRLKDIGIFAANYVTLSAKSNLILP